MELVSDAELKELLKDVPVEEVIWDEEFDEFLDSINSNPALANGVYDWFDFDEIDDS